MPGRPPQVNAYMVALEDGRWMLVDGGIGTAEAWDALAAGVLAAAGAWERVALHVVTHMHMDHVGLAARVRGASGAAVWMHRLDAERMRHAAADPADEARYRAGLLRRAGAPAAVLRQVEAVRERAAALAPPVQVDGTLDGEEGALPGASGWRYVWTPGHTAGHVSLFRDRDRVLLAGDAVLPRITPTLGVNRQRSDPVGDYVAALDRLETLRPARVLPGHGEEPSDGVERIRELRAATLAEGETVRRLLAAAPLCCWDIVDARFAGREMAVSTRMLALRETMAHLDRLVAAGTAVASAAEDGSVRYAASD
jgi:glyoxylase-like metal-dependent hydrolase (beta-lactamase superfamily II)